MGGFLGEKIEIGSGADGGRGTRIAHHILCVFHSGQSTMSSASTSYSPPSVADFGHVSAAGAGAGAKPLICVPEDADEAPVKGKTRLEELAETVAKLKERKLENERFVTALVRSGGSWTEESKAQYDAQGTILFEYNAAVRALEAETNKQRLLALSGDIASSEGKIAELERRGRPWFRYGIESGNDWTYEQLSLLLHEKDRTIARLEHEAATRKYEMESATQRLVHLERKTATLTQIVMQLRPHIPGAWGITPDDSAHLDL
jgi:hypothetical protein